MNLLELFKGTGSVGRVAKKYFKNIVSVDWDAKFKPTITTDILNWDYVKFHKETNFVPDFIWASPPCNTFSPLVYKLKERNVQTAEPYSEKAKLGTAILYQTLKIIAYFAKLNPNLKYVIENPRGMMRRDKYMKQLPRFTTMYCLYGDKKTKPTDFWSNIPLKLKDNKKCPRETVDTQYLSLCEKYKIPTRLLTSIFKQYLKTL